MSDDLDCWISTLQTGALLPESTVSQIIQRIEPVLLSLPNVLVLHSPITICGDIHGQLDDLLYLLSPAISSPSPSSQYLFMGDYVDRGHHSVDTLLLLFCLKLRDPDRFHLLRGNHESRTVTQQSGFYNECNALYGHAWVYGRCNEMFDLLPIAAVIDRQIFSVHGGLSPNLIFVENIDECDRVREIPETGSLTDLTWSDPENDAQEWRPNPRGAGWVFGGKQTEKWCRLNRIRFMTRSHQLAQEGFQWYFRRAEKSAVEGALLLVWSAPNYAYEKRNRAAILKYGYDESEYLVIRQFDASPERIPKKFEHVGGYFAGLEAVN